MSDDLTTFAQTFRLDAAAVLVQIAKDKNRILLLPEPLPLKRSSPIAMANPFPPSR